MRARRALVAKLRNEAGGAYPNHFTRTHMAEQLEARFGALAADELASQHQLATVAGRLMRRDGTGSGTLQDASGRIALVVSAEHAGIEGATLFENCETGDILGARGFLVKRTDGELALRVHELHLLVKPLRPLPLVEHTDWTPAEQSGNRPVDLLVNSRSRAAFMARFRLLKAVRAFFAGTDYMEVETPILQTFPAPGGTPQCSTWHNALERTLYLRATPGDYLRRLIVGGIDKLFELNRNFVDGPNSLAGRGNPEITSLDICCAYADFTYMAKLVELLLRGAIKTAFGSASSGVPGERLDADRPFRRISLTGALSLHVPEWAHGRDRDPAFLRARLEAVGIDAPASASWGVLQALLFNALARERLIEPTFVFDIPAEVGPLVRRQNADPELSERFELYLGGRLVAEGASELTDPEEYAVRWPGPGTPDPDFLRALEYGMPPASSARVAIDTLLAVLTDKSAIGDVILFPHPRVDAECR